MTTPARKEPRVVHARNAKGEPVCNSPLRKKPGKFCRATRGLDPHNGRCAIHGGPSSKANAGIANGNYKHGIYSEYMDGDLARRAYEIENDSVLLGMSDTIRILHGRLTQLTERAADLHESKAWGQQVQEAFKKMQHADLADQPDAHAAFKFELFELIQRGPEEYQVWDEIRPLIDQMTKTKEAELKRLKDAHGMVPADQVYSWLNLFAAIVREHVRDPEALSSIQSAITRAGIGASR